MSALAPALPVSATASESARVAHSDPFGLLAEVPQAARNNLRIFQTVPSALAVTVESGSQVFKSAEPSKR